MAELSKQDTAGAKPAAVVIPSDIEGILEMLDPDLPPIPPSPVVTQINPPGANGKPGKMPRMVFGKYMDDPEGEEKKSKKKAAKKKDAVAAKDKDKAEPEAEKVEEVEPIEPVEPPRHAKGTE